MNIINVMKKPTPQEIYEEALKERAKQDPLKKRQACEKGWLAVTEAVDQFLAIKGKFIKKGSPDAHAKRGVNLANLAETDPTINKLPNLVSEVADQLNGICFYAGEDSPHFDKVLKKTVREILELTGFWNGQEE
jgi:hypothetical protein